MSRRNPPNFGPASTMARSNDDAVMPLLWCWGSASSRPASRQRWLPGVLWSGSRQGVGMADVSPPCMAGEVNGSVARWHIELMPHGAKQAKKLIYKTRDSTDALLGNCIVQGFLTAGDVYVGEVTSDTQGYFELPTPYTGAHYLVAYKAGSPDVFGTTVNTLIPT